MSAEVAMQDAIVDCARRCEAAAENAAKAEATCQWELMDYWNGRAAWWSAQAFREVQA